MHGKSNDALVEVKKSFIHNKGLFAKKNIPKGVFLIEYTGEKVSKKEGTRREKASLARNGTTYIFELNRKYDIDGSSDKNRAKYANHSYNPNCKISIKKQVVKDVKDHHIWLRSAKNIKKGEEITYDYGFSEKDALHECKCSSRECVGFIVARDKQKKLKSQLKANQRH